MSVKKMSKKIRKDVDKKSNNTSKQSEIPENLTISFMYLDVEQGQTIKEWGESGLLVNLFERLKYLTEKAYIELTAGERSKVLMEYGSFPKHSLFKCPKHLKDVDTWHRVRLNEKTRVGGFIIGNVFYVVFLDAKHEFYPSTKKHT